MPKATKLSAFIRFLKKGGKSSNDPFHPHYFDLEEHLAQLGNEEDLAAMAIATAQWERDRKLLRRSYEQD